MVIACVIIAALPLAAILTRTLRFRVERRSDGAYDVHAGLFL